MAGSGVLGSSFRSIRYNLLVSQNSVFRRGNTATFLEITSENRLVREMQLVGNFLDTESGKL